MPRSEAQGSVLSRDEARAGVTGHNVRYVLAFGLAGCVIAFIGIVLYFGHGRLTETLAGIFAAPGTLAERLLLYAIPPKGSCFTPFPWRLRRSLLCFCSDFGI